MYVRIYDMTWQKFSPLELNIALLSREHFVFFFLLPKYNEFEDNIISNFSRIFVEIY